MVLGIIFGVLFLALIIWLSVKYFVLIGANRIALNAFNIIHAQINKRYGLILNRLDSCTDNQELASDTKNLILKALEFSLVKDGTERIIRFANAIFDNIENLSITIEDDSDYNSAKTHYNTSVKELRHYVDVFPTSLMARMLRIKFLDSLK